MEIKEIIKKYQCCGCYYDNPDVCYAKNSFGVGCIKHRSGTLMSSVGKIFLGMPKGFNRIGATFGEQDMSLYIFESWEEAQMVWKYDKFNIPCWKYKNDLNHIFVRGLRPRINQPFLHIILENCIDKINCLEITNACLKAMD